MVITTFTKCCTRRRSALLSLVWSLCYPKIALSTVSYSKSLSAKTKYNVSDIFDVHWSEQIPSLVGDPIYDRYSACLAATEGLRRIRDADISKELRLCGSRKRPNSKFNKAKKEIEDKFNQDASRVLEALGMSLNEFTAVGKKIFEDDDLARKVNLHWLVG